jgi:hypothetical protein
MADMGNIKTKHRGGFSASKPGVEHNPGHPEQKPGNADGRPDSTMRWKERGIDSTKPAAHKK